MLEEYAGNPGSLRGGSVPPTKTEHPEATADELDLPKVLERLGGDQKLFKELAELLLKSLPEHLARVREAISHNDARSVERSAHSLKDAVGNLGAKRAVAAADRLEQLAREGLSGGASEAFLELQRAVEYLGSAVQQALSELQSEDSDC